MILRGRGATKVTISAYFKLNLGLVGYFPRCGWVCVGGKELINKIKANLAQF